MIEKQGMKPGFGILVLLAGGIALAGCGEEPQPSPETVRSIKAITVTDRPVGQRRRFSGELVASERSELSFQVGGRVQSVAVDVGVRVRADKLLASLDARPYQLRVDSAIADLEAARAKLRDARNKLSSTRSLFQRNIASQQDFDSAQASYDSAVSSAQSAEAALSLAQRDLDQTVLVAPIQGLITERRIEPFQEVRAGDAVLVIQSQGGIEVDVRVPETAVHLVEIGQAVTVEMATRTFEGRVFEGRVTELGGAALDANAYPVTISIEDPDPRMRPGMTARVGFTFEGRADATGWLVPMNAVVPGDGDPSLHITERDVYVFVFSPESGTVSRRKVRVVGVHDDQFEIGTGLSVGEVVAVAGAHFLREGQRVTLLEEPLR